jgi:hypothetical protein
VVEEGEVQRVTTPSLDITRIGPVGRNRGAQADTIVRHMKPSAATKIAMDLGPIRLRLVADTVFLVNAVSVDGVTDKGENAIDLEASHVMKRRKRDGCGLIQLLVLFSYHHGSVGGSIGL